MIFTPQKYKIEDRAGLPFIDIDEIKEILTSANPTDIDIVIAKSLNKERLSLQDTAVLIVAAKDSVARDKILAAAATLKKEIYGERIVLFAPLYIGNKCINNCRYCGFRRDNTAAVRRTLSDAEIVAETKSLEDSGHKRLILVYGEHPIYSAEYIAHTVKTVYGVRSGAGEIRRVNINAAPMDVDGFRTVKESEIGTYQIFQETYNRDDYSIYHPSGRKADYDYRLTALDRAMEAGIDDVGIGSLLGLSSWREELLSMMRHTNHLEACFGVGPHTISFPRIKDASEINAGDLQLVNDHDFITFVAILRLAVPYTGLILTARESADLRDRLIEYGVSQIDGGTKLEIGGYSADDQEQDLNKEQFRLSDERSLAEIARSLVDQGRIPSFCTACYRKGRTGEHFMEFSTKGFIKRYCTPNALLTFAEYIEDYGDEQTKLRGWELIEKNINSDELRERLKRVRRGERDILY